MLTLSFELISPFFVLQIKIRVKYDDICPKFLIKRSRYQVLVGVLANIKKAVSEYDKITTPRDEDDNEDVSRRVRDAPDHSRNPPASSLHRSNKFPNGTPDNDTGGSGQKHYSYEQHSRNNHNLNHSHHNARNNHVVTAMR